MVKKEEDCAVRLRRTEPRRVQETTNIIYISLTQENPPRFNRLFIRMCAIESIIDFHLFFQCKIKN
jgi:hypothetical protein